MRRHVAVFLLMVAACSQQPPLQGIDLPSALMPEKFETSIWAVDFRHDFEPGFWDEGRHFYTLSLQCDIAMDDPLQTDVLTFTTNSRTQVFDHHVYIRLVGLSDSQTGPRNLVTISTEQPTTAAITLVGIAEENARAASQECAGELSYDGVGTASLTAGDPFRP